MTVQKSSPRQNMQMTMDAHRSVPGKLFTLMVHLSSSSSSAMIIGVPIACPRLTRLMLCHRLKYR
ncbi:hypothetical protein [Tianweitania populi]|uniref:hypothetical protein n=1 Tax=Tianweitania populi TaxID=1607949 RepID=UPI00167505CE|nr:hypothetical protein [Tianweitania populi]